MARGVAAWRRRCGSGQAAAGEAAKGAAGEAPGDPRRGRAPAAGEAPGDPRPLPVAPAARGGGEGRGCGRRTARLREEEEEVVRAGGLLSTSQASWPILDAADVDEWQYLYWLR